MLSLTPFAVIAAFLLNIPLSLLLLRLYRRAVLREMQAKEAGPQARHALSDGNDANARHGTLPPLSRLERDTPLDTSGAMGSSYSAASKSVRCAAAIAGAAGMAFVMFIAAGWILTLGGRFYSVWSLWWFAAHAWPVPLVIGLVAGADAMQWLKLVGLYLLVLLGVSIACLVAYRDLSAVALMSNWLATMLVAVPIVALLYRPIRAVGLLVFVFTLVILATTPNVAMVVVKSVIEFYSAANKWLPLLPSLPVVQDHPMIGFALAMMLAGVASVPPAVILALTALFGIAVAGFLGWKILRAIGRAYAGKRLSDQSLLLDVLWGSLAFTHALVLLSQEAGRYGEEGWAWIAAPTMAFGAYKLIQRRGLAVLCRRFAIGGTAPVMVLLRVFSLGRRSEQLFDALAPHWLRAGSMVLIAGPDLASGTVQPPHFLEFLARRIRRLFIADEADLRRRLSELDLSPDPDGRYRVNHLFCFGETWMSVMRLVARRADCVLMDLRSFSPANRGCEYELEQLLDLVPLDRTLLIVDRTTDWPFLEATLRRGWAAIEPGSPNRRQPCGSLRIFALEHAAAGAIPSLMQLCLGARPQTGLGSH